MASDYYDCFISEPDLRLDFVRFVGGTTAVTKTHGNGVTVTYIGVGLVDLTWSVNAVPGTFVGLAGAPAFQATTAAGVKGFTCVPGVYDATTRTLRLNITGATEVLTNLAALQWLSLTVLFKAGNA